MTLVNNIDAHGPWVLVEPDVVKKQSAGGIYLPDGNAVERMGHTVATVVSVSQGYYAIDVKSDSLKYNRHEVTTGDRVVFRGHLKEANQVNFNDTHCFMHVTDLVGILAKDAELDLAMPYGD